MNDINNDLYDLAEQLDIEVLSFELSESESVSLEEDDKCYIGLDNKQLDTAKEERVHLAHELGHCMAGGFYDENADEIQRAKCENRATRWAVYAIIDRDEFLTLLKAGMEKWDLADHFNVNIDFIAKAYYYYVELQPMR